MYITCADSSQPAPQDLSSVVKAKSVARPRDIASLVTVLKDSLEFSAESPHSVCTLKVSISNRAHQSLEVSGGTLPSYNTTNTVSGAILLVALRKYCTSTVATNEILKKSLRGEPSIL